MDNQEWEERGYKRALEDVESYALHWLWLEAGERGTGEAMTVAWVVYLLRQGKKAPRHRGARGRQAQQKLERDLRTFLWLARRR